MKYDHDRYQSHCRFCYQIFEGDSAEEAIRMAEKHEQACEKATENSGR